MALLAGCFGEDDQPHRGDDARDGPPPNILVVMTDDQTAAQFDPDVMPYTTRFFAERGTEFGQAIAAPPLCCPARAGFLTGQYAHNNGVDANTPGYPLLRDPDNTLPVWLRDAGYRTGFVGKYLNGYELAGGAEPAPGWDRWLQIHGYADYFGYTVSDDGSLSQAGTGPRDYSTRLLTREGIRFTRSAARRNDPFFLWLAYNAPHTLTGGYPPPCDGIVAQPPSARAFDRFADAPLPKTGSFDEADVSDKGRWVRSQKLGATEVETMTRRWRCGLASLRTVDAGFRRLTESLEATGELDDTLVVFLSDNGYFFGEHRIADDKRLPYEPALRVPLAIRMPAGTEQPPRSDALVANVDLAPTLLDLAGAKPCVARGCRRPDGSSLVPLLTGDEDDWRQDRGVLVELDDGFTYSAIRTPAYLYAELTADRRGPLPQPETELYDLAADPDELENVAGTDPALEAGLAERLDALRRCAGATGKDACE